MTARARVTEDQDALLHSRLSLRLAPVHARQRLGIEQETEARVFGRDKRSFHLENLTNAPGLIRFCLQAVGLLRRAQANSLKLTTEHNAFVLRSEEHTSELQSRENLVCRLLLEKKKIKSTDSRR